MAITQSFLHTLTGDQLLLEVKRLVACERTATAALLRSLIEVDTRKLYLLEGCSSLFTYCTQVLHLAEGAAYNRIEAARAARRFPIVLDAIAEGSISLTTTRLLAPHLTAENQCELLDRVRHKSKRDVEVLIAAIHPKPAVATCMRKLPAVPAPIVRLANTIEQTGAPALVAEKKSRGRAVFGTDRVCQGSSA